MLKAEIVTKVSELLKKLSGCIVKRGYLNCTIYCIQVYNFDKNHTLVHSITQQNQIKENFE